MVNPRKYGSAAERQAAYRKRNGEPAPTVTDDGSTVTLPPPTVTDLPGVVTLPAGRYREGKAWEPSPGFVSFVDCPDVPRELFYPAANRPGVGRGVAVAYRGQRYVMVARGDGDCVVSYADYQSRLGQRCAHGWAGWQCRAC